MKTTNGKNTLIFLPNTLEIQKTGYIRGIFNSFDDAEAYYVTSDIVLSSYCRGCIGYVNATRKKSNSSNNKLLLLCSVNGQISVNLENLGDKPIVQISYDYSGFKNCDPIESDNYGIHFRFLASELKKTGQCDVENGRKYSLKPIILFLIFMIELLLKVSGIVRRGLSYSATFSHLEESLIALKRFLNAMLAKKVTPMIGNMFLAKLIDMALGIILLNYFLRYESNILDLIQTTAEDIISNLKGLLLYLMGSPIGLKLNYAFNKSLGQFFFYHISLWRIFLYGLQPLFTSYFKYFVSLGALGFSFQMAMISDVISVSTFHVYCIYVYAARLFSLQLRGLVSLWRLFIGRKYNPLRERVDSCQYSPNQLFIGTLGFTVLLFLLPTTIMYYTVFSMFRLFILLVDTILLKLRRLFNMIPLYIALLWIIKSPLVAGTLRMKWQSSDDVRVSKIEVKLDTLTLTHCIKKCTPQTVEPSKPVGYFIHCIVTGTLV